MTVAGAELVAKVGLPISLLQRILLTTDGTVTHILEAYAEERIKVAKLAEWEGVEELDEPRLEAVGPQLAMRRTILLQGSSTGRNYLYAESVILPQRIDPVVAERLRSTNEPIGKLLVASRMETFREVLACGNEPAGDLGPFLSITPSSALIYRTYRMITGGHPALLITEKFPAGDWTNGSPPAA